VVQLWFPGGELGHVLADVLSGDAEPSGRLPITFPRALERTPAAPHHPGDGVVAVYGEGSAIGHRWYDRTGEDPLFWFGYGLSYTEFSWRAAAFDAEISSVAVEVTNIGARPGHEVVQVYVRGPFGLRFAASRKVTVMPGETQTVTVAVPERAVMVWGGGGGDGWRRSEGPVEVLIGAHAGALRTVGVVISG